MGSITDLVDFRANDLFPDENIDWGCEKNEKNLSRDGDLEKPYYTLQNGKRVYCEFSSRTEMDVLLKRKRVSLKRAIEVYMEEVNKPSSRSRSGIIMKEFTAFVTKVNILNGIRSPKLPWRWKDLTLL